MARLLALFVVSVMCLAGGGFMHAAQAHEIRPAVAELVFDADGRFRLALSLNVEVPLAGIDARDGDTNDSPNAALYDSLRALEPAELERRIAAFAPGFSAALGMAFDNGPAIPAWRGADIPPRGDLRVSRISVLHFEGAIPPGAESFTWTLPERFGALALKQKRAEDADFTTEWLPAGTASTPFPLEGLVPERTTLQTLVDYLWLGYLHIVPRGLDHILFVLGLYLLGGGRRPLLIQVTSFTVAHSITLALSLYGVIALSPRIVEPLIALSIAFVAIENIFLSRLSPWRPAVVFAFGLLHGLGFAGVLLELGLPEDQFLTALVGFNVGVEGGQLSVIVAGFLVAGIWGLSARDWRRFVTVPGSVLIAGVGLYWTAERMTQFWL